MPRIQGLSESGTLSGDTLVKTGKGYIFSVVLSWTGAAAGQQINFRDGLDGLAPVEFPFILGQASDTRVIDFPNGKEFDTGIFVDFQGSGTAFAALTYR